MAIPMDLIKHPPFNPIHAGLYKPLELLEGFDPNPDKALSVVNTLDYQSYVYFQQQGRTTISDPYAAMMEALHDASIVRGMNAFLEDQVQAGRRPVSIMGGHREARGSKTYRAVARIAQLLSESGFIVASGGGPGCMEATHLGALYAGRGEGALNSAVDKLADGPYAKLPQNMAKVLFKEGDDWAVNEEYARELHGWVLSAWQIFRDIEGQLKPINSSLAVPTWHYGHEPFTPLATHVAKYFLNSIREDVLLALASCGIIYSEGRGGTLQEVFQDAAQIYYRDKDNKAPITSMVFFDSQFWTMPDAPDDKPRLPVLDLLRQLFVSTGNMSDQEFKRYVRIVDDVSEAVDIIIDNAPPARMIVSMLSQIGVANIDPVRMASATELLMSIAPDR